MNADALIEAVLALPADEKERAVTKILAHCGLYDNGITGSVGEAIAVEFYGLAKAPCGKKGFDGHLNGRSVSVKTMRPTDTVDRYVDADLSTCDDLMLIQLHVDGGHEMLLAPANQIKSSKSGDRRRYYWKNVRAAATQNAIRPN